MANFQRDASHQSLVVCYGKGLSSLETKQYEW